MILLLLVLLLCGGLMPQWGYHSYGYAPVGGGSLLLLVLVVLLLMGRL